VKGDAAGTHAPQRAAGGGCRLDGTAYARGMRKQLGAVAFLAAWMLNPALLTGCGMLAGFEFGEAEVVAIVDGANRTGPLRYEDHGKTYEVSIQVEQTKGDDKLHSQAPRAAVRQAMACGNRSFLKSAAACLDTTEVPVEGTLTIRPLTPGATALVDHGPARGALTVHGKSLKSAGLMLSSGGTTVTIDYDHGTHEYRVRALRLAR
jgi:hypothetical protein